MGKYAEVGCDHSQFIKFCFLQVLLEAVRRKGNYFVFSLSCSVSSAEEEEISEEEGQRGKGCWGGGGGSAFSEALSVTEHGGKCSQPAP